VTSLELSVLDQSPIPSGSTAVDALQHTIELARLADRLGYRRYWLAEHHNTSSLAGSAPEILIARVAAATSTIRVGSGGVMLTHYSPLKVAENFRLLQALFPGRIDLGIGRAPGSDGRTAFALAQGRPTPVDLFPEQLRDLSAFLYDVVPAEHPYHGVRAMPQTPGAPDIWLLGSSDVSAVYAGYFGFAFSFAHFIHPDGSHHALWEYRRRFQPRFSLESPRASVAVRVLCADTAAEARRLAASFALMRLRMEKGQRGPVPSLEEAEAYPYTPEERARIPGILANGVVGAPEQARARLEQMADEHGVDELVIVTICHDPHARRRSYELLAQVFDLAPRAESETALAGGS
jgi:luciferase family oxidoreductase group 1